MNDREKILRILGKIEDLSAYQLSVKFDMDIEKVMKEFDYLAGRNNNWLIRITGKDQLTFDQYSITFEGLEWIHKLDLHKIYKKQLKFNLILTISTCILAFSSLATLLILFKTAV